MVNRVVSWDGTDYSPLPGLSENGVDSPTFVSVRALAAVDAGDGEKLYVGGFFSSAGGDGAIQGLGTWDGTAWNRYVGAGNSSSEATALMPITWEGAPALLAGGRFQVPNSAETACVGIYQVMSEIFTDDFEAGDTSAWSLAAP